VIAWTPTAIPARPAAIHRDRRRQRYNQNGLLQTLKLLADAVPGEFAIETKYFQACTKARA
jgi:hypothetical protein